MIPCPFCNFPSKFDQMWGVKISVSSGQLFLWKLSVANVRWLAGSSSNRFTVYYKSRKLPCVTLWVEPLAHILRLISKPILTKRIHNLASHNMVPIGHLGISYVQFSSPTLAKPCEVALSENLQITVIRQALEQKIATNVWRRSKANC